MNYFDDLLKPKWQKKRLAVFKRDNWKCKWCGETEEQLHCHHLRYIGKHPWSTPLKFLVTLCHVCHSKFHDKESRPTIRQKIEYQKLRSKIEDLEIQE